MKFRIIVTLLLSGICIYGKVLTGMASTQESIKNWKGARMLQLLPKEGPEGSSAVKITSKKRASKLAHYKFNNTEVIGKTLTVMCDIKAVDVGNVQKHYAGVKLQILIIGVDGKVKYIEQIPRKYRIGSYDWKGAKVTAKIPDSNVKEVRLVIGLQSATGSVLYANIDCDIEE